MSAVFTIALLALVPIGTKGDVVASLGGTGIAVMSIVAIMGILRAVPWSSIVISALIHACVGLIGFLMMNIQQDRFNLRVASIFDT